MAASRILKSAQQFFDRREQLHARALADSERQAGESEARLAELEHYRAMYLRDFDQRARHGMTADEVRTYQAFLARIALALEEQQKLVERARAQHAEELRKWRSAARRSVAVNRIVDRRVLADRRHTEKSAQATADAHAQRSWASKGKSHGR
ncbi:MAG TPA: flagellar FliJ family protein [Steroidobacteraceae bacterium]|nr:flagellar FliJ family protein [Steroidobacteraceae bacterium]